MLTRRTLLRGAAGASVSLLSFGAYALGIEPMLRLEIARYAITPPGWPQGQRLRIVILSDFHACEPWMPLERVAGLVRRANALGGDVTLLLGDYVSGRKMPHWDVDPDRLAAILAGLSAPLGVYAILGNHDWWTDRDAMRARKGPPFIHRALARAGVNVMQNDALRLAQDGRPFWIAGLGDQIAFYDRQGDWQGDWGNGVRRGPHPSMDDLPATLAQLTDDAPAILMAHEPDIFPQVPNRFCLTLSGHTHGGQVNLFGWRPIAASPLSGRYARGHFRENGRDLLVTSGLGCSAAPVRIGVPPEIVVVELGG